MKSMNLKFAVAAVLLGASALAFGAPGGGKGPPEGHGNKPDSEAGFSLSLPAIFASGQGQFTALTCGTDAFSAITSPDKGPVAYPYACGETMDGEVCVGPGNYYVQRDAAWQAPCAVMSTASAFGKWGDNLAGGDAMLKVGSPIRVELLLFESGVADGQVGYHVVKLQPYELDRVSDYGHLAGGTAPDFVPVEYEVGETYVGGDTVKGEFDGLFQAIVFDPDAWLRIEQLDGEGNPLTPAIVDESAGGEINATGKIVYGYNLRVVEAGTYRITYTTPHVTITGCDPDAVCSGNSTSLDIVVSPGGGGGKKSK